MCIRDRDTAFLGELALDGSLRPVSGVLPMALEAAAGGGPVHLVGLLVFQVLIVALQCVHLKLGVARCV